METSSGTFLWEPCLPNSHRKNTRQKTNSTFNNLSSGPEAVINYVGQHVRQRTTRGISWGIKRGNNKKKIKAWVWQSLQMINNNLQMGLVVWSRSSALPSAPCSLCKMKNLHQHLSLAPSLNFPHTFSVLSFHCRGRRFSPPDFFLSSLVSCQQLHSAAAPTAAKHLQMGGNAPHLVGPWATSQTGRPSDKGSELERTMTRCSTCTRVTANDTVTAEIWPTKRSKLLMSCRWCMQGWHHLLWHSSLSVSLFSVLQVYSDIYSICNPDWLLKEPIFSLRYFGRFLSTDWLNSPVWGQEEAASCSLKAHLHQVIKSRHGKNHHHHCKLENTDISNVFGNLFWKPKLAKLWNTICFLLSTLAGEMKLLVCCGSKSWKILQMYALHTK